MSGIGGAGSIAGGGSAAQLSHVPTERATAALELAIMSPEMQVALLTALRGLSNSQGAAMHAMARMVDVSA